MVEKAHLWDSRVRLEEVVSDACQHIFESMKELDEVAKAKWLGSVILQFQQDNAYLTALLHPDTPHEQVTERKSNMEDLATQLGEMEHKAKKVTEATTQFLGSVV